MKSLTLYLILTLVIPSITLADSPQCDSNCDKKLTICEGVISECNDKVKELDGHIKVLSMHISEQEEFIKKDEKYISDLEAYAKAHDDQSWWNTHKMFIGVVAGMVLTVGVGVGVSQVLK